MEEIRDLFKDFAFDSTLYFYHITDEESARNILMTGLGVNGKNDIANALNRQNDYESIVSSTMIQINETMVNDLENFLVQERLTGSRKGNAMILISIDADNYHELLSMASEELKHNGFNYVVLPENIMGYIDLNNLTFNQSDYYECGYSYD